jgi:hypothetical protein
MSLEKYVSLVPVSAARSMQLYLCKLALLFFSLLIAFVGSKEPAWKGYFYAAVLFIVASMKTLASSQHFINVLIVGFRIRSAVILAVYRKVIQ